MRKKPERERKEGQPHPPTLPRKPEDIQHKVLGFGLERWHSKAGEPILFCQPHMSATSWASSTSGTSIWKPGSRQQPFCPPKSTVPRHTHTHTFLNDKDSSNTNTKRGPTFYQKYMPWYTFWNTPCKSYVNILLKKWHLSLFNASLLLYHFDPNLALSWVITGKKIH